jgi:hypothetical protein
MVFDHLHEVVAADQSTGVSEKRHENMPAPDRGKVERLPVDGRKTQRRCGVAGLGWNGAHVESFVASGVGLGGNVSQYAMAV